MIIHINGKPKLLFIGKAKDLTKSVIARLFWQSFLNYTKPYKVEPPEHIQN